MPGKWPDLSRLGRRTPREKSKLLGGLFLNFQACIPPAPHPPEMDKESVPDEKSTEISLSALSAPTLRSGGNCLHTSPHPHPTPPSAWVPRPQAPVLLVPSPPLLPFSFAFS